MAKNGPAFLAGLMISVQLCSVARAQDAAAQSTPTPAVQSVPLPAAESAPPPVIESAPPPAADPGAGDIADMSLEDLLNIKVESASRYAEKISDAPATITAYTDEDLRSLGYWTLHQLADITAGYSSTIKYGERIFETRGQKAGSFNNNKHLVYFDGIPINHARNYKAPADWEFPLADAKRVEFLRGPASSLYGTGAFFGVVNVVPKELTTPSDAMDSRVTLGTRDGETKVFSNYYHRDEQHSLRFSVGYYDKAASRAFVGETSSNNNRFWDNQQSLFMNLAYKPLVGPLEGLAAGFLFMRKNGGLGEHWNEAKYSTQLNDLTWQTIVPYLKYQHDFTDKLQLNSYLVWNIGRERGTFAPFTSETADKYPGTGGLLTAYDTQTQAIQGQAELRWKILDSTDAIAGASIDTRQHDGAPRSYGYDILPEKPTPYVEDPSQSLVSPRYTNYSAFAQLRHRVPFLDGLNITLGAREDVGVTADRTYRQLSPRAGLVQNLGYGFNLKALFASALRAPGIKETNLNRDAETSLKRDQKDFSGIKPLHAETITSMEGGIGYHAAHISSSVVAFQNKTESALDGTTFNGVNIFKNADGKINAKGIEAEVQVAPSSDMRLIANYAWAEAKDADGNQVVDVPVQKANVMAIYRVHMPIELSTAVVGRWVSDYRGVPNERRPPGALLVDANVRWGATDALTVELQVANLLNKGFKLPKNGVSDVPVPGRTVFASLVYAFSEPLSL